MTLPHMRCPYCNGKSIETQRTYTIRWGARRTLYHCTPCARSFSETHQPPMAQLKTPMALVVQVLSALTEGVGINAATRLYGVSKNRIYRWQERLSGVKTPCCCLR
jgi:transposase-like protein